MTRKNVYDECVKHLDKPDWVFRQAMFESGHLKKAVAVKYNNLFGMKFPHQRKTNAIGKTANNTAIYETWEDSVLDYMYWQEMFVRKDKETYCDYLVRRGYCPANGDYIAILKQITVRY